MPENSGSSHWIGHSRKISNAEGRVEDACRERKFYHINDESEQINAGHS